MEKVNNRIEKIHKDIKQNTLVTLILTGNSSEESVGNGLCAVNIT